MSGILRGIKKVFSKIAKVAKVVLPIALGVAAVVFTGGAALGILPTFAGAIGGVVGSLGLSGAVAGALTGSIVSAGFGAAAGFVTGGVKGAQKGALFGAATGGVLGAVNPSTFGVGGAAAKTVGAGLAEAGKSATGGLLPNGGLGAGLSTIKDAVAPLPASIGGVPAITQAPVAVAPAAAAPGGAVASGASGLLNNPTALMMGGNLLTGLFTPSEASSAAKAAEKNGNRLFSDIYSSGDATSGDPRYASDPHAAVRPVRQFAFNPRTLKVEEVAPR